MAENLTADPEDPIVTPKGKKLLGEMLHEMRYFLIGFAALLAICCTLLTLYGNRGALVTLSDGDFTCTQPTATNRFRFDKVETCNQYTRKVPVWLK
ncbi:MAG: hypothetical protein EOP83_03540 [Verrucomicrobiaceae bacterium]|nr:MAG: hypothetical protein EOP83_03540 [Verrucomicrobiaceae bacterium]